MRTLKACCFMILVALVAPLAAGGQRPLPAFTVAAPQGGVAQGQQLSSEPRWLLLYVTPGCRSCCQRLGSLKEWHTPQLGMRTVIVVRGSSAQAAEYMSSHLPAEASDINWYVDTDAAAAAALALSGAPVLIGIERGE